MTYSKTTVAYFMCQLEASIKLNIHLSKDLSFPHALYIEHHPFVLNPIPKTPKQVQARGPTRHCPISPTLQD